MFCALKLTKIYSSLRLVVGTNRWNQGGQSLAVSGNVTHQHYVSATIKNDIGILYTAIPITFNQLTAPVPLSFEYVGGGVLARAAGWGRISVSRYTNFELIFA